MKHSLIIIAILGLLLASCSSNPEFRIDAASDDIGTQNVSFRYLDADGAYRNDMVTAIDGKFSFVGRLGGPTYIEVYDAAGKKLGEFIADRGDNIKARFSVLNPENITVEGNKDAELLKDFMDKNRGAVLKGDTEAVNAAIAAFIADNPKQFASTALLLNYFTVIGHEQKALRLLQSIGEKYRPGAHVLPFEQMLNMSLAASEVSIDSIRVFSRHDTAATYSPRGSLRNLIILADNETRGADSILRLLQTVVSPSLRIVDMGCDRDTLLWYSSLRSLPDDYPSETTHYWLPSGYATEGIAAAVPASNPYFILTDSLGSIIYRTPSATAMSRFVIHKKR